MKSIPAYKTEVINTKSKKVQYLFESKGVKSIVKAIEYTPISKRDGKTIFNLGFGDYDEENDHILDNTNSNNGDMRKVFNTVLNTVPKFFQKNENAAIWVQGSDSGYEFKRKCQENCKKNCDYICKNFNRRIKTYQYYIDKNFVELSKKYKIFGFSNYNNSHLTQYIPKSEYLGILIYKKK